MAIMRSDGGKWLEIGVFGWSVIRVLVGCFWATRCRGWNECHLLPFWQKAKFSLECYYWYCFI